MNFVLSIAASSIGNSDTALSRIDIIGVPMKPLTIFAWSVFIAVIGASGSFALAAGSPPAVDTSGASSCAVRGYLTDRDPKGTNVRGAPRADAPIIGYLPPAAMQPEVAEVEGAEFDIVGAKNGWLLIRNAEFDDKVLFAGPGWISGRLAGTTINNSLMRAEPSDTARVTLNLENDQRGWGPDSYTVIQIHNCRGEFADVSARDMDGKVSRGWVTKLCSAQLTTCP